MSERSPQPQPIELQGLTKSYIGAESADVTVKTGSPDLTHPQLHLEGGDDAFMHKFEDGRLKVRENADKPTAVIHGDISGRTIIEIGDSSTIRGTMTSGDLIRTGGGDEIIGSDIQNAARRRALLLIPQGYEASHDISIGNGDVNLEDLAAKVLKVATVSGAVALKHTEANDVTITTKSGEVKLDDVNASTAVSATTKSGAVDIINGSAPSWRVDTKSGDITAQGTKGKIEPHTKSGQTHISQ